MNFAEIKIDKDSNIGDLLAGVLADVVIGSVVSEMMEKQIKLNQEIAQLAEKYDCSPTDMIANISGTIFANHCDNIKNNKGFDAEKEAVALKESGENLLSAMDNTYGKQGFEVRLLTLLNAVITLANEEDKSSTQSSSNAKTTKRVCNCSRCAAKAQAESTQGSANMINQDKITSILDELFDLVK